MDNTSILLSLDDFQALYEREGAFEILHGEKKALMPPVAIHGWILRALFRILDAYCQAHKAGECFTELPYVLTYQNQWVKGSRVPDLLYFEKARWDAYRLEHPDWRNKPFVLIPDFVVEIVSANDLYSEIQQKVDLFQADGVRLIWIVDPLRRQVMVYQGDTIQRLTGQATLSSADVLPDLAIPLADLFAVLNELNDAP